MARDAIGMIQRIVRKPEMSSSGVSLILALVLFPTDAHHLMSREGRQMVAQSNNCRIPDCAACAGASCNIEVRQDPLCMSHNRLVCACYNVAGAELRHANHECVPAPDQ
jgi:hypothetical protein